MLRKPILVTGEGADLDNAMAKINAMPAPFVLHYAEAANGAAVEACAELSDALAEINNMLREL